MALLVILATTRIGYGQISDDCLGACNSNSAVLCLADADCGDVDTCALPSPACTLPDPSNASWTAAIVDALHDVDPTCPRPTVSQGSLCVLKDDVDLSTIGTMDVKSSTHLNCQGHRIYTSLPGTDANHRSTPEVALHLAGAFGVKIQNCVIDGFDFPILAHDIKLPADAASNPGAMEQLADKIEGNTINGVFMSVELFRADNMRFTNNRVTNTWGNGVSFFIIGDSHINQITGNIITRASTVLAPILRFPGPVSTSNPMISATTLSVTVSQGSSLPNVINLIVGTSLYQFANALPTFGSDGIVTNGENFSADNVIEGNTIDTCPGGCIGFTNTQRPNAIGNQISPGAGSIGINIGNLNLSGPFPGTCTLNSNRLCVSNSDCYIPPVDSTSQGTCVGTVSHDVLSISHGGVIANNTITGPFNDGMQLTTPDLLVQGNTISGPVAKKTDFTSQGGVGIEIRNNAARTAIVTQNVVSNVPAPIRLFNVSQFGAQISLNDFTGYTDEAFVPTGYNLDSELSVGLQGNYWGQACTPTGGGGFDSSKVLLLSNGKVASDGTVSTAGAVNLFLHDSHPYGVPVAAIADPSLLPTTLSAGYCSAAP
jgi:hypothetical protein